MPRSWSSAARSFGPDGFGWDTFARDPTQRPYAVTASSGDRAGPTESAVAVAADEDPRLARMRAEAVLLISKTPLSPRKLAQLAHLADATAARTLIRQLNQVYDNVGRAIRIEQVAGGYRMLTRPALAPWLTRLGHLPAAVRLSTPMMETLAVVAYRQPVSRASAEAIRGVACGELLRQLMERDLIRIAGRSEELGRPYLYGTTKRFLQVFGLASTDDLPPMTWHTLHEDDSPAESLPSENSTDDDPGDRPIDSDNASSNPDLPPDDLSTSTKEPVVSTPVASVLGPAAFGAALAESGGALATEFGHPTMISPPSLVTVATDDDAVELDSIDPAVTAAPAAIIEDEEDEIYGDDDDEEDDDWDDDDDEDDDWDDDDDEDDDDEDDDEEELDDDWEEVDDDDDEDDDEEEADVEEADVEDDDEDWSEDDDVESDDDDDDEEEWD